MKPAKFDQDGNPIVEKKIVKKVVIEPLEGESDYDFEIRKKLEEEKSRQSR